MTRRKVAGASSSPSEKREQDAPATLANAKPALTPKMRFPEFRDKPAWEETILRRVLAALQTHKQGLLQQLFPGVAGASSSSAETREQDAPATLASAP